MNHGEVELDFQDLAIDEIRELLLEMGAELSGEQVEQLARFVNEVGGLDEALETLNHLAQQRHGA
jgi:hypothetical protein